MSGQDGSITTTHSNILDYYYNMACNICYYLENDKVIRAKTWVRTKRNPDVVLGDYIHPIIETNDETPVSYRNEDSKV